VVQPALDDLELLERPARLAERVAIEDLLEGRAAGASREDALRAVVDRLIQETVKEV